MWAVQHGYVDDVPVDRVKELQGRLTEFLSTRKAELLARVLQEKAIGEGLEAELRAAVEQFKQAWK